VKIENQQKHTRINEGEYKNFQISVEYEKNKEILETDFLIVAPGRAVQNGLKNKQINQSRKLILAH